MADDSVAKTPTESISAEAVVGLIVWPLLFVVLVLDLLFDLSKVNKETEVVVLFLLVLLPSAASFKGGGFEFIRRTKETTTAFKDEFAKLEGRISELEDCCDETKGLGKRIGGIGHDVQGYVAKQNDAHKVLNLPLTVEEAKATIRDMLSDRAYNMRSLTALQRATGLASEEVVQILTGMKDVRKVIRNDTRQVFYGFTHRVNRYFHQ